MPYRTNAYNPPIEKVPMRIPSVLYAIACSGSIGLAGLTGEFLSRDLPENHFSCSGLFVGLGFIAMATFFGLRTIRGLSTER